MSPTRKVAEQFIKDQVRIMGQYGNAPKLSAKRFHEAVVATEKTLASLQPMPIRSPRKVQDEETQIRKFTERYSKCESIEKIPERDLKQWAKLTDITEGQYISKYMTPELWADSIHSLHTAVSILESYSPKRSAAAKNRWPSTITALRLRILQIKSQRSLHFKNKCSTM